MSARPTCATCRFWQPPHTWNRERGECRRLPPGFVAAVGWRAPLTAWGATTERRWPQPTGQDWCGEHRPPADA